jgi:hypothetical protein
MSVVTILLCGANMIFSGGGSSDFGDIKIDLDDIKIDLDAPMCMGVGGTFTTNVQDSVGNMYRKISDPCGYLGLKPGEKEVGPRFYLDPMRRLREEGPASVLN